jgi:ERCC4-type nuclease
MPLEFFLICCRRKVKEYIKERMQKMPMPQDVKNSDDGERYESLQRPNPVAPPPGRLIVKRNGHSITRKIPKPIVLIDTREKAPFNFSRFPNWIAAERSQTLKVGDYSVEGMETLLVLERKTLADLITTLIQQRERFFYSCEKMTKYRWRAILIEGSYEDIKSPYDQEYNTSAHPNAVSGTLDALEARFGIPVIYTSGYRPLAEEKAASWLSKHFTYWYLEENGFGRVLQEGDL